MKRKAINNHYFNYTAFEKEKSHLLCIHRLLIGYIPGSPYDRTTWSLGFAILFYMMLLMPR
ncbi:hypothetical protein [Marivirga harenae]|uniref:hypothetical protein n=1 Tax=Marivirga harenae TaxID=2010992 RepID=UPI0026E00589|nr:hypothetical protein [Marivirga harenae]WKV11599.1 hypothetical protein Q3Y49_15455 [Marivirga harenae]